MILVLLNTLIAMMADSYTTVWGSSFKNYAYAFARLLHEARCTPGSTAVPFNLVSVPYQVRQYSSAHRVQQRPLIAAQCPPLLTSTRNVHS